MVDAAAAVATTTATMTPPTKILWVSRVGYSCSYDQVSRDLLKNISPPHYQLSLFTIGISPAEHTLKNIENVYNVTRDKIHRTIVNYNMCTPEDIEYETMSLCGFHTIGKVVEHENPDICICLDDSSPLNNISMGLVRSGVAVVAANARKQKKCLFVAYLPVDCVMNDIDKQISQWAFDAYITITEFGRQFLSTFTDKPIYVLPHIVDPCRLTPSLILPTYPYFTVVSVNANHVRKRWDLVFRAFFRFAKKYQLPTRLIVKTNKLLPDSNGKAAITPGGGTDLRAVSLEASKLEDYNAPVEFVEGNDIGDAQLANIYASANAGLYMSSGEGFGYTPIEQSLFGVPSVIPRNTSFREIFENYDYLVDTVKVPIDVGRCMSKYVCIFKAYSIAETGAHYRDHIKISPNICTFRIGPNDNDDYKSVESFRPMNIPPRMQVLCYVDYEFMRAQEWRVDDHIFNVGGCDSYTDKYIVSLSKRALDRYVTLNSGYVEIADIEDASEKLLKLTNQNVRTLQGKICKAYAANYTPDTIATKFKTILKELQQQLQNSTGNNSH